MTIGRILSLLMFVAVMALAVPLGKAFAQDAAQPAGASNAKIEELLKLLDDPQVRAALEASRQEKVDQEPSTVASDVGSLDVAFRDHLRSMITAAPRLPSELAAARQALANAPAGGESRLIVTLLLILIPSFAIEWLVRRRMARIASAPGVGTGETSFGLQLFASLAPLLCFAIIAIVLFLASGSSPLPRKILGVWLVAIIVGRVVYTISALLLDRALLVQAAEGEPLLASHSPETLRLFWRRRIAVTVGYFAAAWAVLGLLPAIGFSKDGQHLLTYIAGIGLLAIAAEIIWRKPRQVEDEFGTYARRWLLMIYLVLLWFVWAAGLTLLFWLGLYAIVLPRLLSVVGKASQSFLQAANASKAPTPIRDVLIARGARAFLILLAVAWIGFVFRMNPGVLATSDDVVSRLLRSALRSILILVAADLIWQFVRAWIDTRIALDSPVEGSATPPSSRLRTLLPIFRNALAVLVITIAVLMILSEFGVQIGPLIAGAGIFGVAIGFGSQTLVKDIVSGIFYLTDDAFRVGEYIQSGSYKGTVEGFSLRSVRLRHHRGPVFTVPFGTLGAVQNMSRDWVIDKFIIRFPFETNIKLVKKLTKTIGADLEADPELGPLILQTVKMKGVEQIGDYGIDVSFGVMTKPGYQTTVRRRAYSMMKDVFEANGIEFARPSVHVGSEEHVAAAGAASTVIARQKAAEAAKAGA